MDKLLMKIQDTVMKYADIVSQIADIDVEVVDNELFRVAGTGMFRSKVNMDMSEEGYVYRHVLRTGKAMKIYDPGNEEICRTCPNRFGCREEIEISMPVRMNGDIIGIIGLVGTTREQKMNILKNEKLYMEFLEQISEFISAKAQEYVSQANKAALIGTLNYTMDYVTQGIIILGQDGTVTTANETAKQQLKLPNPEGLKAVIEATSDHVNSGNEYMLWLDQKKYTVLGQMNRLPNPSKRYHEVLLFTTRKDIQNKVYEITSTVQTLSCRNIIGGSERTQKLKADITKVAQSTSTVLITGESGTGKEMVATAIWNASDRKNGKFVAINCAAIPEALLESELFGYVKGAFTGADPNGRIGKFELANKGIIFLDEIGDMPLYLQAKLLRVLQERQIVRIGSNQQIPINVRVLAATNKNLKEMIREKKFREDLYYRLNVIPIEIAPLRERKEDIEALILHFANRYAKLFNKDFWKIPDDVMERLKQYPWPGNVRELENVTEFMINMMGPDGILGEDTLPQEILSNTWQDKLPVKRKELVRQEQLDEGPILSLKEVERREIQRAIAQYGTTTQGKRMAAKELGIGLATLYRKLEELGI